MRVWGIILRKRNFYHLPVPRDQYKRLASLQCVKLIHIQAIPERTEMKKKILPYIPVQSLMGRLNGASEIICIRYSRYRNKF